MNHHYFFYGMGTEDAIAGLIKSAEAKGCEFLQLIPAMLPVQTSHLALANGRSSQPQMVPVLRLFVRCKAEDFAGIEKAMREDAEKEKAEGLRHGRS